MKMFKRIPVFILLFTGYLCNAQDEEISPAFLPPKGGGEHTQNSSGSAATKTQGSDRVPGRTLPTLVVAGVSIALVLLCILIVAVFWYAWKKSQEGSIELNPIPYGEAGVSLRVLSAPENQKELPFERAVQ